MEGLRERSISDVVRGSHSSPRRDYVHTRPSFLFHLEICCCSHVPLSKTCGKGRMNNSRHFYSIFHPNFSLLLKPFPCSSAKTPVYFCTLHGKQKPSQSSLNQTLSSPGVTDGTKAVQHSPVRSGQMIRSLLILFINRSKSSINIHPQASFLWQDDQGDWKFPCLLEPGCKVSFSLAALPQ